MKITTQRDLIRKVAKRWREQYEPFTNDPPIFSWRTGTYSPPISKRQIAEKLDAIDTETATAADVEAIIGNDSWTDLKCDECGKYVDSVLTVGDEPDFESRTASLCRDCVKLAVSMFADTP